MDLETLFELFTFISLRLLSSMTFQHPRMSRCIGDYEQRNKMLRRLIQFIETKKKGRWQFFCIFLDIYETNKMPRWWLILWTNKERNKIANFQFFLTYLWNNQYVIMANSPLEIGVKSCITSRHIYDCIFYTPSVSN